MIVETHVYIDNIGTMKMTLTLLKPRAAALTLGSALLATAGLAAATDTSPEGVWRTIDDRSGQPRSIVVIERQGSELIGRIRQSLDPKDPPGATCAKCTDHRKDQPIIGTVLLNGLQPAHGKPLVWEGGQILDPDSGTVYRARITLRPDGRSLEVRGYVGISAFGRTQVWQRAE